MVRMGPLKILGFGSPTDRSLRILGEFLCKRGYQLCLVDFQYSGLRTFSFALLCYPFFHPGSVEHGPLASKEEPSHVLGLTAMSD